MATLRLVPASGAPIEITGETALVGREPGCEVMVGDGSVSRRHARLEKRPGGWTIVDQGSANGTFLDSQRVAEALIGNGQELRFGAVSFKVELKDDDLEATMLATPSPDATVVASAPLMPTPPLGIESPVLAPKPAPAAPPPPLPKAAPAPPSRPAAPPTAPPAAPKAAPAERPRTPAPPSPPPLPGTPSAAAAKERFSPRVSAAPPAPVGQMAAPPAAPKKGRGPVFWVITGCCGCLLLGVFGMAAFFGSIFFSTQAPANAVQTQLADLRKGDLDAAYRRLSPELQAQLPPEQFEALVREHAGLGQNKDATFWNRSVKNDQAKLTGVLTAATGEVEPATFELTKVGNDWRITAIRVGADAQ